MNEARIRAGVVDDHRIIRTALRQLIQDQSDMQFVGEAWDGRSAIDLVRAKPIDVLILDLQMEGRSGMDVLHTLTQREAAPRVLVLSHLPEQQYATKLIRLGAMGYLNKQCEPDEIMAAVRAVASGKHHISEPLAMLLADSLTARPAQVPPHEQLSDREFRLLIHFARGSSSAEAAHDLALSPKTVSTYRTVLLDKMGMRTNSDLTRYALRQGLVD